VVGEKKAANEAIVEHTRARTLRANELKGKKKHAETELNARRTDREKN